MVITTAAAFAMYQYIVLTC